MAGGSRAGRGVRGKERGAGAGGGAGKEKAATSVKLKMGAEVRVCCHSRLLLSRLRTSRYVDRSY